MIDRYDVVISGAGPAGSTAALVLARAGARVLLLDRAAFPRDKPCAEYLSPQINLLLRDLGLEAEINALRPVRLRGFRVYAQDGRGFRADFAGRAGDRPALAYGLAVPRIAFDTALAHAATRAGAELWERTRTVALAPTAGGVSLRVLRHNHDETIKARLALAADGLRSPIARGLGLLRRRAPHRIGLVTHLEGVKGLDEYGEMHTSRLAGYCGIAPLGDGRANVAMVVDQHEGRRLAGDPAGYLRAMLATYPNLAARVRQARPCKPVLTTSALSWSARRYHAPGVALAGDATGYYDPFTGEGIYRAMAGGRLAGLRLLEALQHGEVETALRRYDRDLCRLYRGKLLVEQAISLVVHHPLLFYKVAARLRQRPYLADTLVGVTGDYLSPWHVINPSYLARLVF